MKKLMALLLCTIITFGNVAYANNTPVNDLKIGDYIQLGQYQGAPIIWRYAADDKNGRLIVSDKILCLKYYDVQWVVSEDDSESVKPVFHTDCDCAPYSVWQYSTIYYWLNSTAPRYNVKYDNKGLFSIYGYEKGFLSTDNFQPLDIAVIKKTMQKTWRNRRMNDPDDVYYQNENNDFVFLLDLTQLYYIIYNSDILGEEFIYSQPTPQAINANIEDAYLDEAHTRLNTDKFSYFLRAPFINNEPDEHNFYLGDPRMLSVKKSTDNNSSLKYSIAPVSAGKNYGIRPAFYLNDDNTQILSGDGTEDKPYIITGINKIDSYNNGTIPGLGIPENERPFYVSLFVNGTETLLEDSYPGAPHMENNTIYIPVEMAMDVFNIKYDADKSKIFNSNTAFFFKSGSNIITTTAAQKFEWNAAPIEKDGVLFFPLRALAEQLGGTVKWYDDKDGQSVFVDMP